MRITLLSLSALAMLGLQGCDTVKSGEAKYPTGAQRASTNNDIYAKPQSIFGEDGLKILGGGDKSQSGEHVITVNSFLWRASLDTISFMPITSVDPFGGVILTDWYASPNTTDERYKLNVFVLGSQLRSDAIKVSVFKERNRSGKWASAPLDQEMARSIEDTILTRARELRVAQLNSK